MITRSRPPASPAAATDLLRTLAALGVCCLHADPECQPGQACLADEDALVCTEYGLHLRGCAALPRRTWYDPPCPCLLRRSRHVPESERPWHLLPYHQSIHGLGHVLVASLRASSLRASSLRSPRRLMDVTTRLSATAWTLPEPALEPSTARLRAAWRSVGAPARARALTQAWEGHFPCLPSLSSPLVTVWIHPRVLTEHAPLATWIIAGGAILATSRHRVYTCELPHVLAETHDVLVPAPPLPAPHRPLDAATELGLACWLDAAGGPHPLTPAAALQLGREILA